jgi:uncharacterized protein
MITSKEVSKHANFGGVRPQQIEKDYIISWVLWGISDNALLRENLIFKGGTCLKKMYIKEYRYSEDMDFTLKDDSVSDGDIYNTFSDVFNEIETKANLKLSIPEDSKETHPASGSISFYIIYIGPLGGKGDHVKVDITRGEKLEYECLKGNVLNDYSDLEAIGGFSVQSYHIKEIFIEKMAALMGRTVPRDLYDFNYLASIEGVEIQEVYAEFQRKAENKGHSANEFAEKTLNKKMVFKRGWEANLSHQIKDLGEFKEAWREFNKQLRKIRDIK